MEVHHHPNLNHIKKNLKEYILEGLMIFLAVTLGFFAETIRENISERHREKNYAVGLINNLQSDTAQLNRIISSNDLELRAIDSMMKIPINGTLSTMVQDSIFYYAIKYTFNLSLFQFNDLTLAQLRNAGGYSVFKTSRVVDSIAQYEFDNNQIKIQEKFYIAAYDQTWVSFKQVFNAVLANQFFQAFKITNKIPSDMDILISKDQEKIHFLYNNYVTFKATLSGYNHMLSLHYKYISGLILFLKETYKVD